MKPFTQMLPPKILTTGGKKLKYDEIIDLLNCAMFSGFTPIDVSISNDVQTPNCAYNSKLDIYELLPIRDYTITIRLRDE